MRERKPRKTLCDMPAKMDPCDNFLSDVAAFFVRDHSVDAEFGHNGRFVHIFAIEWNAGLDPQRFERLVVDLDSVIQHSFKSRGRSARDKEAGSVRPLENERVAARGRFQPFAIAEDLKIRMSIRKIFENEIARKREAVKILPEPFARRRFGLDDESVAAFCEGNSGEQTALRVRKGGKHRRSVLERLHVVRDEAVEEPKRFRAGNCEQPAAFASIADGSVPNFV